MAFKGLFDLQSPQDLLDKLRADFKRMEADPEDQYAAFDFFVTGWHVLEWLHPGDQAESTRTSLRNQHAIPRYATTSPTA